MHRVPKSVNALQLFGLLFSAKAGIIHEEPHCKGTDSDNDEREPGLLDGELIKI